MFVAVANAGGARLERRLENEPDYDSVEEMLSIAFKLEPRTLYPKCGWDVTAKGTNPVDLTPLERIAQGQMIRTMALEAAGDPGKHIIGARYRVPVREVTAKHDEDCFHVQFALRGEFRGRGRVPRLGILLDTIREWSYHSRATRSWEDWSRFANVPRATLYRWRQRCVEHLDRWLIAAEAKIHVAAQERGLVE